MHYKKIFLTFGILILMFLGSCGDSSSTTTSAIPTQSSKLPTTIGITTANVNGGKSPVLTDANGKTLYYYMADTAKTVACTGDCLSTWHPLLLDKGILTSAPQLPGSLSLLQGSAGNQVEYNGHPLYTYAQDKNLGDAIGEGLDNKWHVATPSLASQ
jgi:predicted lipoprotein with Yx(FWY)xxD motif